MRNMFGFISFYFLGVGGRIGAVTEEVDLKKLNSGLFPIYSLKDAIV